MTFHAASYDSNLGYVAQDDRQLVSGLLDDTQGVFNGPNSNYGGLVVSAGSGMTSSVALGRAAVLNSFQATQGGLWVVRNDAAVATAAHAGNASGNPRWDCVGVRVYDSDTGGDTSDITVPLVLQGTASSSAAIGTATSRWNLGTADMTGAPGQSGGPALPNNFLPLYMALVPNGASSSSSFSYLDWRLFITGGQQSTPWTALTLNSNWGTLSGSYTPVARIVGSVVYLRGVAQNNTGSSNASPLANIPTAFMPAKQVSLATALDYTTPVAEILTITTLGLVSITPTIPNGDSFTLDGLSYTLV